MPSRRMLGLSLSTLVVIGVAACSSVSNGRSATGTSGSSSGPAPNGGNYQLPSTVTSLRIDGDAVAIDVNPLVQRNIRLQGSFSHNYPVWERVIDLLNRGLTLPETIVGMRAPLESWREAFDAMHEGRVI